MQHAASTWRRIEARLRDQLDQLGEPELLRRLGVSRQSLYRFLAGLPVRRGTAVLLEQADNPLESAPGQPGTPASPTLLPTLVGYEVQALRLGQEVVDGYFGRLSVQDDFDVYLDIISDGAEHQVFASMTIIDDRDVLTTYDSDTIEIAEGSPLQEWLNAQLDDIWATVTAAAEEATDESE